MRIESNARPDSERGDASCLCLFEDGDAGHSKSSRQFIGGKGMIGFFNAICQRNGNAVHISGAARWLPRVRLLLSDPLVRLWRWARHRLRCPCLLRQLAEGDGHCG